MNSLYGAACNAGFRFFNQSIAESITLMGQYTLRTVEAKIDAELNERFKTQGVNYIIYCDTDSLTFEMKSVVEKYKLKDNVIKKIEKIVEDIVQTEVNKIVNGVAKQLNVYDNKLFFKLEAVGDKAIYCCLPDTKILANGSVSTIEDYYLSTNTDERNDHTISFNSESRRFEHDIIYNVYRKPYQGKIYKFTDENGDNVTVTEDHVMFVLRDDKVIEIKAMDVVDTDQLISGYF